MKQIKFSELCGFTSKQWIATEAANAHKYMLFGGSRGPGKSHWLRYYLLYRLLHWAGKGIKGVNVLLGCEDYPSLKDRQVNKIALQFPPWLGALKETKDKGLGFHLHKQYGGGSILLRNLDDPSKYQSAEFAGIAIDELTKNPERTFHILRGSLRWPGIDNTFFVGATNPQPNWVRDYWIEKRLPDELKGHEHQFAFVPALPDDNPHLPSSYWEELDTLPGALRQAWRYGDWYAAVEGLVLDNFTVDNMTDELEPDKERPYELAIDDGYIDPRATLFIQRQPNGDVLIFDELYQTKTLEERTIADINEKCKEHGLGLPQRAAVSHEAVALRQRLNSANIAAQNWMANPVKGERSTRVAAITLTRSFVCDGQGHRALIVHKRCRNLLDEILAGWKYPEGKHGVDERPVDGNDHACDALTSWIWMAQHPSGAALLDFV